MGNTEHDYGTVDASFENGMIVFRQHGHGVRSEVALSASAVRGFKRALEGGEDAGTSGQPNEDYAVLQCPGNEARLLESPSADGSRTILLPKDRMLELFGDGLGKADAAGAHSVFHQCPATCPKCGTRCIREFGHDNGHRCPNDSNEWGPHTL